MIAAWLRGELSGAVVQFMGLRSARVQDFYAVSMQASLGARADEASLIRAIVSFDFLAQSRNRFSCKFSDVLALS
jgi:hypothetical protein